MNKIYKTFIIKSLARAPMARFGGAPAPAQLEKFNPIAINQTNIYDSLLRRLDYHQVGLQHPKLNANKGRILQLNQDEEQAKEGRVSRSEPVYLYKSENVAGSHLALRDYTILNLSIYAAIFGPNKILYLPVMAYVLYGLFKSHSVQVHRKMVADLQLLPSENELRFRTLKNWIGSETKTYKVDDLEIVDTSTLEDKELTNDFWPVNTELDQRIVFKSKSTNEKFVFDKNGEWDWSVIAGAKQAQQQQKEEQQQQH